MDGEARDASALPVEVQDELRKLCTLGKPVDAMERLLEVLFCDKSNNAVRANREMSEEK
jgi:hypothetical protein